MQYHVVNEAGTARLAARLAARLRPGDVVALSGGLGAGKSVFARAVMRALGVLDEALPSPSFSIIQQYQAKACMIAHMDWYRLQDEDEIDMLGVREYLQPPWICLIEWPERAPGLLPSEAINIHMHVADESADARLIEIADPLASDVH